MAAVWYRFRAELRTRWRAWLGLALLVALASGAVMALAAGARRTDSAYDRFLDAHNAYDVMVLNYPADGTAIFDFDELVRLPQVAESARADFEYLTFNAGNLLSQDGRIGTEINRFKLLDGRPADPGRPDEMVVGFTLAERHGLEVGDAVELLPAELIDVVESGSPVDIAAFLGEGVSAEQIDEGIGAFRQFLDVVPEGKARIVGIEAAPGEFPPQFQLNRPLVHLTPALSRLVGADLENELLMLRLHGGTDGVDGFLAELEDRSDGRPLQVHAQRDHVAAVNRSIHLQALALWLLAGLTVLAAALILVQLVARLTYLESDEHRTLAALGMTQRERVALGLLRSALIAALGGLAGVVVALLASPLFPTGLARTAEPSPGFHADLLVLPAGAALTVGLVTALSAWPAWRVARTTRATDARDPAAGLVPLAIRRTLAGAPAPAGVGVRMALEPGRGRSAVPVRSTLGGVSLGVAALTAALTFGASLGHLLDDPRLYGVTWDLELTTFEGRGLDPEDVEPLLNDDRIAALAIGSGSFEGRFEIEGLPVDGIGLEPVKGDITPPILEGRAPVAGDEIVLGPRTLRSLVAEVGDVVAVRLPGLVDTVDMRVVGTAVFPPVSETAQLGEGALVTPAGIAALRASGGDEGEPGVILGFAPGADHDEVAADATAILQQQLDDGVFPIEPSTPNDIVNFGRVETMPFVLGGILAAISAATLAHLLLSAVRRRRRDLAILKTLGFVRRQVAGTVAWQATTVVVIGLAIGIPVGVAVGRWTWALLADNLGVVSQPVAPLLAITLTVTGAVGLANLIAFLPGQLAARTRPATVLRAE